MRLPEDGCSVCKTCCEWFPTFFLNCRFCGGPLWDVQFIPAPRPGEQGRRVWYPPGELSPAARYGLYSKHSNATKVQHTISNPRAGESSGPLSPDNAPDNRNVATRDGRGHQDRLVKLRNS